MRAQVQDADHRASKHDIERLTVLATGSSQPVLYIEFRKDGSPVDPGPWWAAGEGEKVRG